MLHRVSGQVRARIAAQVSRFLTDTCLIELPTATTGPYGEPVEGWEVVQSDVPCRLIDGKRDDVSDARLSSNRETILDTYRLIVAYTVPIAPDYRVTVNGAQYTVASIADNRTDSVFNQAVLVRQRG